MQARGVTVDLIAPGKICTVFGYLHTSKPDEAPIEYIVLDGKRIELRLAARTSVGANVTAMISIVLWLGVLCAGRLIAYF